MQVFVLFVLRNVDRLRVAGFSGCTPISSTWESNSFGLQVLKSTCLGSKNLFFKLGVARNGKREKEGKTNDSFYIFYPLPQSKSCLRLTWGSEENFLSRCKVSIFLPAAILSPVWGFTKRFWKQVWSKEPVAATGWFFFFQAQCGGSEPKVSKILKLPPPTCGGSSPYEPHTISWE